MIKFVYFDVGGVVISDLIANSKWENMKKDLGVTLSMNEKFEPFFDKYEREICKGRDIETLVPVMKRKFGLKVPKRYSFLKDFVNRFERNESIWPVIKKSKQKSKIGLLTNMYPGMLEMIEKKKLMPNILWDVIIDSSVEKVVKPQKAIFKLAQERAKVKANEILFVENSKTHVEAAKRFGWQTFLYDSTEMKTSNQKLLEIVKLM
jgi:HAD superfamily hydrolase (TIGR01509 family)